MYMYNKCNIHHRLFFVIKINYFVVSNICSLQCCQMQLFVCYPFCLTQIVLWMMFGCKYVNSILEVIGSQQADERGVKDLLQQLQQMESLLPE